MTYEKILTLKQKVLGSSGGSSSLSLAPEKSGCSVKAVCDIVGGAGGRGEVHSLDLARVKVGKSVAMAGYGQVGWAVAQATARDSNEFLSLGGGDMAEKRESGAFAELFPVVRLHSPASQRVSLIPGSHFLTLHTGSRMGHGCPTTDAFSVPALPR